MKAEKLNVEPAVEVTLTRLQAANEAHSDAVIALHDLHCAQQGLRSRINDLGAAIKDLKARTAKQPSMASLSIDQIRALSASKASEYAELSGLNAALDCAEVELRSMESDERGIRLLIADTRSAAWSALYEQLKAALDLELVAKLVAAGFMVGMSRRALCDDLLGEDDTLDAGLAESLAQQFGMPL
jgi:hypothetical protein